jgi:hypothetical protein
MKENFAEILEKVSEKNTARARNGINQSPVGKVSSNDRFSNCTTKSQLDQFRRFSNKQIYLNIDLSAHKGAEARLKEREFFHNLTPPPGKTYKEIKSQQRKKDNSHLIQTFGNQKTGIHGEELPKFRENLEVFINQNNFDFPDMLQPAFSSKIKYLKKANLDISEPPNKLQFSPENYRTKSQYLRVRDKNVGALKKSKVMKNLKFEVFSKRKKIGFFFKAARNGRMIRSRGFMCND